MVGVRTLLLGLLLGAGKAAASGRRPPGVRSQTRVWSQERLLGREVNPLKKTLASLYLISNLISLTGSITY